MYFLWFLTGFLAGTVSAVITAMTYGHLWPGMFTVKPESVRALIVRFEMHRDAVDKLIADLGDIEEKARD